MTKGCLGLMLALVLGTGAANAAVYRVANDAQLATALQQAVEEDELVLEPGVYAPFTIEKEITVRGEGEVIVDAKGKGSGVTVKSAYVKLKDLHIRNFGSDLYERDAGVRVWQHKNYVHLENLTIEGPGFGIRADSMGGLTVKNCSVRGDASRHILDRGDGIYAKYVTNLKVFDSRFVRTRDGIYIENVDGSEFVGNYFSQAQYGIHWMYSRNSKAVKNRAENVLGAWAVMSTNRADVYDNVSYDTVEFGILLNVADACRIKNNRVYDVHNPRGQKLLDTEGKGLFIYGPGVNQITKNLFSTSDVGIGLAMSGESNQIWENAIVDNKVQVRYVGEAPLQWSRKGKGNYWSSYLGWDLNHDKIGDKPYQPNDSLDRIFWIYPEAQFLMDSPVVALLRWLADQFEIDRGKGVTDSYPLMLSPITYEGRRDAHR